MSKHSADTLRRRQKYSRMWAIAVVGWSVIRTLILWAAVGDYGLNPWIYLGIDLCSATVDAVTTPKMVLAFIDDEFRRAALWGLVSLVAFIVPDLYVFLGTRHLPRMVIVVLCVVIGLMLAMAIASVVHKVHAGRRAREASVVPAGHG